MTDGGGILGRVVREFQEFQAADSNVAEKFKRYHPDDWHR